MPPAHQPPAGAAAELYGILLYCNAFTAELIRITTESRDLADRLPRLMKKVAGFSFDQEPDAEETGKLVFTVDSQEKIHKIFAQFGLSAAKDVTLHVNYGILEEDEERLAFLRGAFLSGGSVTDPAKRYHLELTTSHYKVSRETCALLLDAGFSPKETTRGGNSILYFKQSNLIEDFLTAIGAPVCAMGVMEAKVEKDLRNGVNRRVNCETANLTKVVTRRWSRSRPSGSCRSAASSRTCRRSSARRRSSVWRTLRRRCRSLPPCRIRLFPNPQ